MIEKIPDHRGNTFHPTRAQFVLYRAGWRLLERRKMGMIWRIKWADPTDGQIYNQGTAIQIQKDRKQ